MLGYAELVLGYLLSDCTLMSTHIHQSRDKIGLPPSDYAGTTFRKELLKHKALKLNPKPCFASSDSSNHKLLKFQI